VVSATATGATLEEARLQAYRLIEALTLPGGHYRRDIALRAVRAEISVPA
jgi:phosphoribosylamine--glycine ligase